MHPSPRILFVGPMLGSNPGWVPNPMEILAPYLEAKGYACLFTSRIVNRYRRFADMLWAVGSLRNDYDVVCLQMYSGLSLVPEDAVSALAQKLGKPIVMVLHGGAMPKYMKRFPSRTRHVFSRAHLLVTPSAYLAEAVQRLGFEARVIPNIISIENYPYRQRRTVRPMLLWMRTFYPYYNPEMALYVLNELLDEFPDGELTLAGQEKGIEAKVKSLAVQLGIAHCVHFPGFLRIEHKREQFARHDIFLNTTYIDNMPVCLVEAGAFGLPIVSTNVGGVPYMVKHEESALLVPPNDVKAMANAVRRLVNEPALASKLSANGRVMAERSSPENVVPLWEEIFSTFSTNIAPPSPQRIHHIHVGES